jgi:hypothetical protein
MQAGLYIANSVKGGFGSVLVTALHQTTRLSATEHNLDPAPWKKTATSRCCRESEIRENVPPGADAEAPHGNVRGLFLLGSFNIHVDPLGRLSNAYEGAESPFPGLRQCSVLQDIPGY